MKFPVLSDEELRLLRSSNPGINFDVEQWCPTCKKKDDCHYRYEGKRVECDCETQMQLFKHYLVAGIGDAYHRLRWADFARNKNLVARISKYIDNPDAYIDEGMGFIFTGPVGTGKTMLANLTIKELVQRGFRCHATAAADVVSNMTAGWRDSEARRRFEKTYVYSQVLLLDDLGRELIEDRTGEVNESHKFKESVLDSILRDRVQYARPTFITTNLSIEDLSTAYGGAVQSLLSENSIVASLIGDDYRGTIAKRKMELIDRGEKAPIV